MREISIYLGYKWMLRNPKFSWSVYNDKLDTRSVMEYFLQSVGTEIFYKVKTGESFVLHIIGDKSNRAFVLRRLRDGDVYREADGMLGKTYRNVYSVNLEMTSTGQKFSINHYYAGGGNTTTVLSGAGNAINSFKSKFSDYLSSAQQGIQDFKDNFHTDRFVN